MAYMKALDLLHRVMRYAHDLVPPHRDDHRNGHQSGYIIEYIVVLFAVALTAAKVIRSELSPDGGVQWLPV